MRASLLERLRVYVVSNRTDAHRVFHGLTGLDRRFLLRSEIVDAFAELACEGEAILDTPLAEVIGCCQEGAVNHAWLYLALRLNVARWLCLRVHLETMDIEQAGSADYLHFKERLATGVEAGGWTLEFDVAPFSREMPKLQEADSIGQCVRFLNRRLSSRMFETLDGGALRLLDFLRLHRCQDQQLMLSADVSDLNTLRSVLRQAESLLGRQNATTPWDQFAPALRALGFEPGWGGDARRTRETMGLLRDLLEPPRRTSWRASWPGSR